MRKIGLELKKLMFRITDENPRVPSPIRTVKRIPQLQLACDSTVESVGENGPLVSTQELKELINKREELLNLAEQMKKLKNDEREKAQEKLNLGKFKSTDLSCIVHNLLKNSSTTSSRGGKRKKSSSKSRRRK